MSQLTLETRQPEPPKILVESLPEKEGKKLSTFTCIVCSGQKIAYLLDENKEPLVLRCRRCGHKSWYHVACA